MLKLPESKAICDFIISSQNVSDTQFHIKVTAAVYLDFKQDAADLGVTFTGRIFGKHQLILDSSMIDNAKWDALAVNAYVKTPSRDVHPSLSVPDNSMSDKLQILFNLQEQFNCRVGWTTPKTDEEYITWMNRFITALQQETSELRDSVPWKWWKHQPGDKQNAKVEIIDIFHFVIALAQTCGMSAEDLYHGYLQKNKINHTRQDNGYSLPGFEPKFDDNKTIQV